MRRTAEAPPPLSLCSALRPPLTCSDGATTRWYRVLPVVGPAEPPRPSEAVEEDEEAVETLHDRDPPRRDTSATWLVLQLVLHKRGWLGAGMGL
jgi:hypothetical protein